MLLFCDALKAHRMNKKRIIDLHLDEFEEAIEQILYRLLTQSIQNKESEELLTRREVVKRLKIAPSTLSEYTKKGILTSYYIGNRVYYKWSEILSSGVKAIK